MLTTDRRRNVVVTVGASVMLAGVLGCTAEPPDTTAGDGPPSTTATAEEVRLLSDVPEGAPVEAGRYAFPVHDARSPAPVSPVVSVPDGYTSFQDGAGVFAGDLELADSTDGRALWTWDIDTVYEHPCDTTAREVEVGPTVADLANALATQPLRAGTAPAAVTVGGYPGLFVELSVPDDLDPDGCPTGRFNSWPGRWQQAAGQVDMIWIVDVEGQRIVFDAPYGPGTSPADVQELKHMVTTATFSGEAT